MYYHGEKGNAYKILVRKPEGQRSLGKTKRRWENNIKMVAREIELEDVDWIHLSQRTD
jgi:hypothetical protein